MKHKVGNEETIATFISKGKIIIFSRENGKVNYYKGYITDNKVHKVNFNEICRVTKLGLTGKWSIVDEKEFDKIKLKLLENEI